MKTGEFTGLAQRKARRRDFACRGKSASPRAFACPAPFEKIFLFFRNPNHRYIVSHPVPEEGRWPSSRTLGRDAVDASGALDEGALSAFAKASADWQSARRILWRRRVADGEVAWS